MRPAAIFPPLLLLLLGSCSGQLLFSVQRPVFRLPSALAMLRSTADAAQPAPDYKQQVEQRNAQCYAKCAEQFPKAEGSARACERGCRLFALAEATASDRPVEEHRDKCSKDCEVAYPVLVEQHSCQSGCSHQRPKQQAADGAPVVMSVVRKFSFDSSGGQEVRRAQSSLLVQDGDRVRLIQGPAQVTVTRHEDSSPLEPGSSSAGGGMFPSGLDQMMERMREKVGRLVWGMGNGAGLEPEHREPAVVVRLQEAPVDTEPHVQHARVGAAASRSGGWRCLWSGAPHYVTLAVLLLGTALVLYTVYCVICLARRRRRRRQQMLLQDEEQTAMADDLPPKYSPPTEPAALKAAEAGELPPTYVAEELPTKLDV